MPAGKNRLTMILGLIIGLVAITSLGYGLATWLRGGPGADPSAVAGMTIPADPWHRQAMDTAMGRRPSAFSAQGLEGGGPQDGVEAYFKAQGGLPYRIEVNLDRDDHLEEVWLLEAGGRFSERSVTRLVWLDDDGAPDATEGADVTLRWTGRDWEITDTAPSTGVASVIQELSGELSEAARAEARDARQQRATAEANTVMMIARAAQLQTQAAASVLPAGTAEAGSGLVAPRAWDEVVLSLVGQDLGADRREDVTEGLPYQVDLYQGINTSTMNRAKIDIDRDGLWDEELTIDGSAITLRVAPADDEDYTETWAWAGDGWAVQE